MAESLATAIRNKRAADLASNQQATDSRNARIATASSQPYPSDASTQDFYGFLKGQNRGRIEEILATNPSNLTASQFARDAAATAFMNLRSGGGLNLPIGYANLASILSSQGKTDPMRLNQQLSDISRSTQGQQVNTQEMFARAGLGGSGVGQAISAAQGAAGNQQRSQAIAQENQMSEARRREDLNLLYNLIIAPSIQGYGIERGQAIQGQQLQQQNSASQMAFYASLLGAISGIGG